jgi:hypothetical protein
MPNSSRQVCSIVKTVYGMLHADFVANVISVATLESISRVWEQEWASAGCGEVWRDMSEGRDVNRLPQFARGGLL